MHRLCDIFNDYSFGMYALKELLLVFIYLYP